MRKKRRKKDIFTVKYADLSSDLDRKLRVLAELCFDANPDTVNPDVIPELGHLLLEYLRDRLALEHAAYERVILGLVRNDERLWEQVKIFKKSLRNEE